MARLQWAHICDHAFLDQHGKPCLIGLFDRILAPRVPAVHRSAALAFRIVGNADEPVTVRILLLPPGAGEPLLDLTNPDVNLGPTGVHDAVLPLHDLPFQRYGSYELRIELDSEPVTAAIIVLERPLVQ